MALMDSACTGFTSTELTAACSSLCCRSAELSPVRMTKAGRGVSGGHAFLILPSKDNPQLSGK